jgi:hypothetical protein
MQAKMVYLGNTVEQANTTMAAWTKLGWKLISAQILPGDGSVYGFFSSP